MSNCDSVYEPREDSTLLEKHVRTIAFGDVLDMGTGSGIQAITAALNPKVKSVLALDVQKEVIDYCKKNIKNRKITFAISDLFSLFEKNKTNQNKKPQKKSFPNKKFDTIIFNPPYLPQELTVRDIALEGGKKGYETLQEFLGQLGYHLKPSGIALILFSSLTKKEKVDQIIAQNFLDFELLESQHLFFEELYVYKLSKSEVILKLEAQGISDPVFFAKGKRGYIFTGSYQSKKIAIKMKNPDSQAVLSIQKEVSTLEKINKVGIGPKLLVENDHFLAYGFVDGIFFPEFIERKKKSEIAKVIKDIFTQLFILDGMKLSKEEMSHPPKHILITKKNKPVLIDFERAHYTNKPANVTQFCDYISSEFISSILSKKKIAIKKNELISAARDYKKTQTSENFKRIIGLIK